MVELDSGLAAAQIGDHLLESVRRILRVHTHGPKVAGVSEAMEELRQRVPAFERQASRPVRTADEILHQQELVKEGRRQEEAVVVYFPTTLQPARAANPADAGE